MFPDGAGFNPGYRLGKILSIRALLTTIVALITSSRCSSPTSGWPNTMNITTSKANANAQKIEGLKAWIDPEGYRRFIAGQRSVPLRTKLMRKGGSQKRNK